jgi:hypothetical protein
MAFPDEAYLRDFPDRAIRQLLSHPAHLRELIAQVAPELVDGFDFDHVEQVPRDFLMEDWRKRESDLLFRIPYRWAEGVRPILVCVLVEHQSSPDPRMPLRVLLYAVLYWEREWKAWEADHQRGEPLSLSPVLPIVFHTGGEPWRTNRALVDLIVGPEVLKQLSPTCQPLFWDLAEHSPQELLKGTGEWLKALAVVRAERDDSQSFREIFKEVLAQLDELATREEVRWHDLVAFVLSWAFRRRPRDENPELKKAAAENYENRQTLKEVLVMSQALGQSWESWLLERGEAQGFAKGMTEGKAEGEILARRDDIRELLTERFGVLPPDVLKKIEGAGDVARLKEAIRKVLGMQSLDELQL